MIRPLSIILPLALCASLSADVLVHYTFSGNLNDSANHDDITDTTITPGTAYNADWGYSTYTTPVGGGTQSFFARGAAVDLSDSSIADGFLTAQSQGNFLELTITSDSPMNLTTMTLSAARAASSRPHCVLFTSNLTGDNVADAMQLTNPFFEGRLANSLLSEDGSLDQAPAGADSDWGAGMYTTASLSGAEFQNITSVTFRLYGFVLNGSTTSSSDVIRFDNVIVNGAVVPEPSTYALIAGLALGAFALIRRRR